MTELFITSLITNETTHLSIFEDNYTSSQLEVFYDYYNKHNNYAVNYLA